MAVKTLFQTLLIHVMANETYAATEHKQGIDGTNINVLLGFLTESKERNKLLYAFQYDFLPSYLVNDPQLRNISTKEVAITPSTLRIKLGFLLVVIFSTSKAYFNNGQAGKLSNTNSLMIFTRTSGLLMDFTR